jgi:hypothetical protein
VRHCCLVGSCLMLCLHLTVSRLHTSCTVHERIVYNIMYVGSESGPNGDGRWPQWQDDFKKFSEEGASLVVLSSLSGDLP